MMRWLATLLRPYSRAAVPMSEVAIFAAGCFWSVELIYQREPGVLKTAVGYIGGKVDNPTYKQVCTGTTDHAEGVRIEFDPSVVTYDRLLQIFWKKHDPTQVNRQGNDVGTQYRSAIFYTTEAQRDIALSSKEKEQSKFAKPIATQIEAAGKWYDAEEYHQQYLEKGGQSAEKGSTEPIACYGLRRY